MNSEIKLFSKGIHNLLSNEDIPKEASAGSYNWITKDGRIILVGGRQRLGAEGAVGRVNSMWSGYNTKGIIVVYRKTTDKLQYWKNGWQDILTGLTDSPFSCANYSSLAGAFTLFNGDDGFWLINNANPESAIDLYDPAKNFKGQILIDRGRCLLWDMPNDKTGLRGSWIDRQNATVYKPITGEAIGAAGTKTYSGTLAFKSGGAKRISFALSITDTSELFTDNFDGTLKGSNGGTGTINYATGVYTLEFKNITVAAVTAKYQWQDFTDKGLADFIPSSTRKAGEAFQFPQDEGGDPILNVLIGQDGAYYSIKKHSAFRLEITPTDVDAENILFRKELGLPSSKASISTSNGIVFINTANPSDPNLTILRKNQFDEVEPYVICGHFDFGQYKYDEAVMENYERYVAVACKTKDADKNNVILFINATDQTVDIIKYEANSFAKDGIKLYVGSPISEDVYEILVGHDDEDLSIENEWKSKAEKYNTNKLTKFRRLRLQGLIDVDQKVDIYLDTDNSGWSKVGTVDGHADYVDYANPQTIGANPIGTQQLGGDDASSAYPYFCEIKVKATKFRKRTLMFKATGIGYVDINYVMDWDILTFEDRMPKKYRVKSIEEIVDGVFGTGTYQGTEIYTHEENNEMYVTFGAGNANGSWRMIVVGQQFRLQRKENGIWEDKQQYIP